MSARIENNIVIHPNEKLDLERVVVTDPEEIEIKKKGISYTSSKIYYKDNMGRLGNLYIIGTPQWCFGVNKQEDKSGNLDGFQACYNCSSKNTAQNPTEEEQNVMDSLNTVREALVNFLASEESDLEAVPEGAKLFLERGDAGVKPILSQKMILDPTDPKKKRKIPDPNPEVALRVYAKLMCKKGDDGVKITTKFYAPGDKPVNPIIYSELSPNAPMKEGKPMATGGTMTPVFKVEGVFYGAHGKNPYGASVQIKLSEANYVPYSAGSNNIPRMLGANTAVAVEPEAEVTEEADAFAGIDEGGETENPLEGHEETEAAEEIAVEDSRPTTEEEPPKTKKRVVRRKKKE